MDSARSNEAQARPGGAEIEQLKTLLFRPEAQQLSKLEAQVGSLADRVGTPDRMEKATAEVLVEALRRAEIAQHRELADAIAPMVVAAIRNEIRNSKDMMVEALYPITGRLVSAGIAVALAELAASVNARMDQLFSAEMLKLRFQAWRTGRPMSELALAQARPGTLVRLLYLERGSGLLLGQWQADHGEDARADLLSGMIAALTDFSRNALGEGGGELRTLDLGGREIFLRSSAQMIIAAEYKGELSPPRQRALDAGFLDLLDANLDASASPQQALDTLAGRLAAPDVAAKPLKKGLSPLAWAALVLAALLAWWGYFALQHWRADQRVAAAVAATVEAHPELADYPVRLTTDHGTGRVTMHGLVPSVEDQAALDMAVGAAAAPYQLTSSLTIITTQPRLDAMAAANAKLEQRLAGLNGETRALEAQLASETTATRAQLAERIQREIASVSGRLTQYDADLTATRAKLAGDAGAGVLALHGEIEAGLARLSSESAAIKAETEARMQADLVGLAAKLEQVEADIASARTQLADKSAADVEALAQQIATAMVESEARFAGMLGELSIKLAQTGGDLAAARAGISTLQARLDAPRAKLDEALRGFAVFFSGTDTLEDEPGVRARLTMLVPLARAAGGVRVVGYSDETGTPGGNRAISRRRAEIVAQMLKEAGLEPQRVILVSRAVLLPLADPGDSSSQRSRRVVLEPLYDDEIRPTEIKP